MEYSKDNTMTRKEYLKSKKKYKFNFSKLKYVLLALIVVLLGVYVFKQLKIYNNVTQIANKVLEESKLAKTMTMYYVSDSYTKEGKSSVMLYKSSDESRTTIPGTEEFRKISIVNDKLYGLLTDGLYSIDLVSYNKEKVLEKEILDYIIKENNIFLRTNDGIYKYDISSKELKQIIKDKADQMLLDSNNIYVIAAGKTSKSIIKYNLKGDGKKQLSDKYIVESIYLSDTNIYFVNSKDSKMYSLSKSGGEITKLTDNKVNGNNIIEYKGNIYYVNKSDGNTLYDINLKKGTNERVVKMNIESIQMDGTNIYFKLDGAIGIYKYNIETGKTAQVTSARALEYICIN